MQEMTSKERLLAAMTGQPVDHPPFAPFLAYVWEYFPREVQEAGPLAFHHRIGADPLWRGAPCPVRTISHPQIQAEETHKDGHTIRRTITPVGTLQATWGISEEGRTAFLIEHPLKTVEDFRVQMWIEEHTSSVYDPQPAAEHMAGDGRECLSVGMLLPRGKSAYQVLVESLVGTEELAFALADDPKAVTALWQIMVEKDLEAVRLAAQFADYDYFITWEDSGTQNYSPAQYDTYIASEIVQWCAILSQSGKHYIQHACGNVKALLGRMKDQGVAAVESIATPPTGDVGLRESRQAVGPGVGLIGGIEPVHFLRLSGSALAEYAESVIEDLQGGPFVLANSDSCPPGVTVDKFHLVAEIARRYKL